MELFSKSAGVQRNKYFWIQEPNYSTKDIATDMQLLKSSLSKQYEGTNLFYHSHAVKKIDGTVDIENNLRFSPSEVKQMESQNNQSLLNEMKYRRPFIAFASCEARLSLPDQVGKVGYDQLPQDPINVLHRNRNLLKEIDGTIQEIFKFNFTLLDHTGNKLYLGLSDENPPAFSSSANNLQDEYEKIQSWKDKKFTVLSETGHGIRSMIRLLTSLLEPVNQVIMIDEPEMHLYPSQKRWLGKQLVSLAKNQKKQVFVVTHDPMVLQGILDANTKTSVFRIERKAGANGNVKVCELNWMADANAMRNQDQFLQGLFYQRCIVVEGASDRSFYQNMMEAFDETSDKDLGFVACGGKGGTKHMASMASKVGLKSAFIYDFDAILFETKLVQEVYSLLGGSDDPISKIESLLNQKDEIKNAGDQSIRNRAIKEVVGYRDKAGITSDWATQNKATFGLVIDALSQKGIFIVPKGTLESWAPEVEPKVRFAELAPGAIRADTALNQEFKNFAKKVLEYLDISLG